MRPASLNDKAVNCLVHFYKRPEIQNVCHRSSVRLSPPDHGRHQVDEARHLHRHGPHLRQSTYDGIMAKDVPAPAPAPAPKVLTPPPPAPEPVPEPEPEPVVDEPVEEPAEAPEEAPVDAPLEEPA